jgi:dihydroorotate dehydrogenase (NAD+) catalytic subunit
MSQAVRIGRVTFQNPILLASGTFGFGLEFPQVVGRLGGIVSKAITLEPRPGNPPPRIWEVPGGILNSVGLENPGVAEFASSVLPQMTFGRARVIVNVAGDTIEEYAEIIRRVELRTAGRGLPVAGFELNVSCPNVRQGCIAFGQNPRTLARIVRSCRRATDKLLITKLTANFIDPLLTARAAEQEGSDAVTLINTLFALAPAWPARAGGLSGPAIKPFALYCVQRVAEGVKIPVIGCGGITCGRDVGEFMLAGARMVQLGSINLVDPFAGLRILAEYRASCKPQAARLKGGRP